MKRPAALASILSLMGSFVGSQLSVANAAEASNPDIIVFLTDDQRWDTMQYMPFTGNFFQTKFENGFISNPVCCPSRTSLLTGTYSYTNGVWTNEGVFGGWPQFAANGWDRQSIATVLQSGGYRTGMFGKFLNQWDDTIPWGWDRFVGHATLGNDGEGTPYYNYTLRYEDGTNEDFGPDPEDYSGDVITDKAIDFIGAGEEPHFTYLSFNAPHSVSGHNPPVPAPPYEDAPVDLFASSPNFLEKDVSDKPEYIEDSPGEPKTTREYRQWNRQYARSLMSVDADIQQVVEAQQMRDPGLTNTVFFFLGDNGLLIGNHRFFGKGVPYEESIHVPFMVQGGGFAPGTIDTLVTNVDITPTILDITNLDATWAIDGESLLTVANRDYVLIQGAAQGHSFCGIRLRERKIVRYRSGEWEYYNLKADPYELNNRASSAKGRSYRSDARQACANNKLPPEWPRRSL